MQRRTLLQRTLVAGLSAGLLLGTLSGCGFQLRRGGQTMAFQTIQLTGFAGNSPLASELARALEACGVRVVDSTLAATQAASSATVPSSHVVFDAQADNRDMVVVTKTAYGQVRVMSVRTSVRFRVKRADGSILMPSTEVGLARDLSYNEKDALSKQDESAALQKAMQTDIVGQVLRRLASIRQEDLVAPATPAGAASSVSASSLARP
ncbi:LPS assembly lipoprotein LptE [Aquabacterium sp.]|uniref:LPS-assembly lipoprotein LptE n=1 Tax=Aquabacterium sp. TaxID=1872578 RepID=UPI0035B1EE9D